MIKKQKGVALIQVLLISFMLIVLTVQLSKESREQVKTAIALKQRSEKLIAAISTIEQSKFALLTEAREPFISLPGGSKIGFFGESVKLDSEVQLAFQDEAGLLSLPYSEDVLLQWLDGQQNLLDAVKKWQGTAQVSFNNSGVRDGLMPYVAEVRFLPGWDGVDLSVLTHLPTAYFSLVNAPQKLIEKVYANQATGLIGARRDGKLTASYLRGASLNVDETLLVSEPSETTRVEVAVGKDKKLTRSRKFFVDPDSFTPILELGH